MSAESSAELVMLKTIGNFIIPPWRELNTAYLAIGACVFILFAGLGWPVVPEVGWALFAAGCLGSIRCFFFGEREHRDPTKPG